MRRPLLALAAAGALAAGAAFGPAASAAPAVDPLAYGFQGEGGLLAADADQRGDAVAPSAAQRSAVAALGARAVWGPFGSPKVLTRDDAGYLSAPRAGAPADVARAFVRDHAAVFGLSVDQVLPERLALVKAVPLLEGPELRAKQAGQGLPDRRTPHVVTFRQVFAGAPTGNDGVVTVGLDPEGRVAIVTSSVTRDTRVTNAPRIDAKAAWLAAARDAGTELADRALTLTDQLTPQGAKVLRLEGVADRQTARLVTVPTPRDGVRLAWEVVVLRSAPGAELGEHPVAYRSTVDAATGEVLLRANRLQHADDRSASPSTASVPYWKVFPNAPAFPKDGVVTPDSRQFWCFLAGPECGRVLGTGNTASPRAYDVLVTDDGVEAPSLSTRGNNAQTAPSRASFLTPDAAVSPVSPTRTYDFPFTDQWHKSNCDTTSFATGTLNDIDAATANLFVMHNRMHDWGYYLGFTEENNNMQVENLGSEADAEERENDPEIGNSQAGSIGGGPTFQGRDNANQISLNDGTPGITNQYLWEPLQSGFYAPCTDGAYDMGIVGHEYGHAISNKMTDDSNGLSGAQAGSMGESWSDLMAVEYLNGYGLAPYADENRYSLAPYVTGDKVAGIRNYGMDKSPLNFSNIEYDGNGTTSPHADGEIWNATQFDIRQALIAKWEARGFDADDKALQTACADGKKATTTCPGNRRWIQLIFDGYLLQPGSTSMLDSRDAILAADKMRYRGENLPVLWNGFAKRGMGVDAATTGTDDRDPEADYRSPVSSTTGSVRFQPVLTDGGAKPEEVNVYVGHYEARITPLVTIPGTATSAAKRFEPGTYELLVQAPGFGHRRMTMTVGADEVKTVKLPLRRNLASATNGAEATGDGGNLEMLIDDTEGTNWGSVLGQKLPTEPEAVRGKQVTVDLGGAKLVREVQVSAANRPAVCQSDLAAQDATLCEVTTDVPYDTGGQNRFAALRSFQILTCDATAGKDCSTAAGFTSRLVAKDAFPAGRPRPTAPDLSLRTFAIPETRATHVRISVVDNQCTGGPLYTREANPTSNPLSDPDCVDGFVSAAVAGAPKTTISLSQAKNVRIAELQVFGSRTTAAPASRPAAAAPVAAPTTSTPSTSGSSLPATGPLPLALPALLLTGLGALLVRGRRRG